MVPRQIEQQEPEPQQEEEQEEQVDHTQCMSDLLMLLNALCSTRHATSVTVLLHASANSTPPSLALAPTRPAQS